MPRLRTLLIAVAALFALSLLPATAAAKPGTKWLCKPGLDENPCKTGLETTLVRSPEGKAVGTLTPKATRPPKIDCFYVYPTVSDQPTQNADRTIDPELRSIALYQAARYSQRCRVYAPVYRQVTLAGLGAGGFTPESLEIAYADVRRAWLDYNRRRKGNRGVVLIGHSQGTFMLQQLLAEEIDANPSARRRLVAAILLGGGVTVEQGSDRGGSFEHVRACRSARQIGCLISWVTFNETVPANSIFGRTANEGEEVLCTNPAAPRMSSRNRKLRSVFPSEPFAPGTTIGVATGLVGAPVPDVTTPWYELRNHYSAHCDDGDGANVLQVEELFGAPALNPVPTPAWGLHLVDANIALGNLNSLVRQKARRFVQTRG